MTQEEKNALKRWEEHHKALAADVPVEDFTSQLNTSSLNMHGMSSHLSILMPSSVSSSMMNGTRFYLGAVSLPSLL